MPLGNTTLKEAIISISKRWLLVATFINMVLPFEFLENGDAAVADGIFFPASDLIGYQNSDFAAAEDVDLKESKFLSGFMKAIASNGLANGLGLTIANGNIVGQSNVLSTISYTITAQFYRNVDNNSGGVLPLPGIGDQVGVGDVNLNTIFPNVAKVAAAGTVSGNGVLVPSSLIEAFSAITHAAIDVAADSREWFASFMRYLVINIEVRSATKASAITAAALGGNVAITLPAAATNATNPTTSIAAADLSKIDATQRSFSLTLQRIEDLVTKLTDVNVVTA